MNQKFAADLVCTVFVSLGILFAIPTSMLLILAVAGLSGAAAAGWFTLRPVRVTARSPHPQIQAEIVTRVKVLETVIQPDAVPEFAEKAS